MLPSMHAANLVRPLGPCVFWLEGRWLGLIWMNGTGLGSAVRWLGGLGLAWGNYCVLAVAVVLTVGRWLRCEFERGWA